MNLGQKYKQLFEGRVSSNDSKLLKEETSDPVLAKLFQQSKHADARDGEDVLYKLTQDWEDWNVDNDDKYDELVDPLFMAVELIQDQAPQEARAFLKTFNKDVVKAMRLHKD